MMLSNYHQQGRDSGSVPRYSNNRKMWSAVNVMGFRVPKKAALGFLAASGFLALMGPNLRFDLSRRLNLATTCIHNIYATSFEEASVMPMIPERLPDYIPVHLKLCYEWLRRDALNPPEEAMPKIIVLEHEDICLDWTAPHYAMMEIIANNVLQKYIKRLRYRHGCPHYRHYEESKYGFDWSPLQTVFQEPNMAVDIALTTPDHYKQQCKYCLEQYDPIADANRIRSRSFHHCFAFPEESSLYHDPAVLSPVSAPTPVPLPIQADPTKTVAPMAAVLDPLRTRLFHSAVEWMNVTDTPPFENDSGTVILIDPGTLGIDPTLFKQFIDPDTTSISIVSGPLCYAANLPTGQNCATYGEQLKAQLIQDFPGLGATGFEGGPGINFQISASTAGIHSRATLAKHLLCAPRTIMCPLPAIGKPQYTDATLLAVHCPDCPGSGIPEVQFLENLGTNGNVACILLPDETVPPITEGTPSAPTYATIPGGSAEFPVAPYFSDVQQPITGDAYPDDGSPTPAPVDLAALPTISSYDVYKGVESDFPPVVANNSFSQAGEITPIAFTDGVYYDYSNTETVPTTEEIQAATEQQQPLDTNTPYDPPQEETALVVDPASSPEFATDESGGLGTNTMDDSRYEQLAQERKVSRERIITGFDGNYLFEIPCPTADDSGNAIITDDGYAITDNGDTVIVSDGYGTVTFESPVSITTVPVQTAEFTDPVTNATTVEEYVEINDPTTGGTVNVTQTGKIGCDCDAETSLQSSDEIGQLIVNPETGSGCLLTMGEARLLQKKDEPKTHTIIEGTVVSAGNENVPPSDSGTVVMNPDGSYAITQQSSEFTGFLSSDPLDGNSGQYQQIMSSPLEASVTPVPWDQCQRTDPPNPIYIILQGYNMVVVDFAQTFLGKTLSWVAMGLDDLLYGGSYDCNRHDQVPFGNIKNSRRMAMCKLNEFGQMEAEIDIFIHDPADIINQQEGLPPDQYDITPYIPDSCEPTSDYGNKCRFKYRVSCAPLARRRLSGMAPDDAAAKVKKLDDDSRILFAKNIIEQCPELGKPKIYDHFQFGGNAKNTKKIPVHQKGAELIYPGEIARAMVQPIA